MITYKEGSRMDSSLTVYRKTFVTLYQSLQDVLKHEQDYDKVVIVRSLIPTREIFLMMKKTENTIQVAYQNIIQFMFKQPNEDILQAFI